MGSLEKLQKGLAEYRSALEREDTKKDSVSDWSLYQQIEHVLIVNAKVLSIILNENEWAKETKPYNLIGRIVLFLGIIPRGKAKAPKVSNPEGKSQSDLKMLCTANEALVKDVIELKKLKGLPRKPIADHPYFGGLNGNQWIRLLEVHQRHHLKIIKDILR